MFWLSFSYELNQKGDKKTKPKPHHHHYDHQNHYDMWCVYEFGVKKLLRRYVMYKVVVVMFWGRRQDGIKK